jgi:hypothetical protein
MPTSRTIPSRRDKVRKYGAKNSVYQRQLAEYKLSKSLGYIYPENPPQGGNGMREFRMPNRRH